MARRLLPVALLAGLVAGAAPSAASAAIDCTGPQALMSKSYKITDYKGNVVHAAVSDMTGRVRSGDTVKVTFAVRNGCAGTRIGLASYRASSPTGLPLQYQVLYDSGSVLVPAHNVKHSLTIRVFGTPGDPNNAAQCDQQAYAPGGNGANVPGPYDPTCNGAPSMNGNGGGNATGRPCAGCVGNADAKNPPGQMPNGSDHNAGYECDRNRGIGRTNPAHTGCTHFQVDLFTGPVLAQLGPLGSTNTYGAGGRLIDFTNG